MIWHPLVWTFGAAALTGGVLYFYAFFFAMDVAANWAPERTDRRQLRREHRAEASSLLAKGAFSCLFVAALAGVVGIALFWHRIVPGAMCGTGVLQAMDVWGTRAMFFWGLALIVLYGWHVADGLERKSPDGVLSQNNARLLLTASPFLLLAFFYSQRALLSVDTTDPVSCCAAVYDRVLDGTAANKIKPVIRAVSFWGSALGSMLISGGVIRAIRRPGLGTDRGVAFLSIIWALFAAVAVKQIWSSYYYQVLSHPCPWCLFLTDHYGVGFLIFGSISICVLEGTALWVSHQIYRNCPVLAAPARLRCQVAHRRILTALVVYTCLTLFPALHWRISTGAWLNGNHF